MRKLLLFGSAASFAVFLAHCVGDEGNTIVNNDSGTPENDASQSPDTGGGNPTDSGSPQDSGGPTDSGGGDAGVPVTGAFASAVVLPDVTGGGIGGLAFDVAISQTGSDIVLVGSFSGTLNVNGFGYTANGTNRDIFIIDFNAANNGVKWVKTFGGPFADDARAVTFDDKGNVYVAGSLNQGGNGTEAAIAFGSKSVTINHGGTTSFVVKLDSGGTPQWAVSMDATSMGYGGDCESVAWGPKNTLAVGCNESGVTGYVETDGGTGTRPYLNGSINNVWVAELEPAAGEVVSGTLLSGAASDNIAQVAYDSKNSLYAIGNTASSALNADSPSFTINMKGSANDAWVMKLADGAPRTLAWSQNWGTGSGVGYRATGSSIAVDANDRPFVSGMFISTIDFGGAAQLTAAGTTDAYILALDPTDGKTKAQTQVGGTQSSVGLPHVAIDDIGNVAFSAYYGGIGFTLAGTSLPASVGQDFSSIVAKFPASLAAPAYAKVSASAPDDAGNSSGIRAWSIKTSKTTGESLVAGSFSSSGDVGDGKTTTRTVGGNGYLLRRAR